MKDKDTIIGKSNSKRRYIYIVGISFVILVTTVILIVGNAFSWFIPPTFNEADATVNATDFTATMFINTAHGTSVKYEILNSNATAAVNRIYVKGHSTQSNVQYTDIGKKKLKINYKGDSSAYLKVTLFESWYFGSTSSGFVQIPDCDVTYTLAKYNNEDFWVFNPEDGCFYSNKPVSAYSTTSGSVADGIEIPFVNAMAADSSITYSQYTYFDLTAVIEAVQPDRLDEFGFNIPGVNVTT